MMGTKVRLPASDEFGADANLCPELLNDPNIDAVYNAVRPAYAPPLSLLT